MNEEVRNFAREELNRGVPKDQLADALKSGGWNDQDVQDIFASIETPTPTPPVTAMPTQQAEPQVAETTRETIVPEQPIQPQVAAIETESITPDEPKKKHASATHTLAPILIVIVLLAGLGGVSFAYMNGNLELPFMSKAPLDETNIFSGAMASFAKIDKAKNQIDTLKRQLKMIPKEEG